jgi:Ser/Thr protein kinase RdoA (MazF antagonist)
MAAAKRIDMIDDQPYCGLIEQNYPLHCRRSERLQAKAERIVLKLDTSVGEVVAKINTDPAQFPRIERDLRFLNYVTAFGLNCPTLIQTSMAQDWLKTDDVMLYLLHFIPGQPPTPSAHFFRRAGELLGLLHQLPVTDQADLTNFSLVSELPYIRDCMAQIEDWPDDRLQDQLHNTLARLETIRPGRQSLIHTDFFKGNLVMRPDGELYLVDLDDAGVGDPLLDLGFFIGNDVVRESAGIVSCTPADLEQVLMAYIEKRPLRVDEFETLPDYVYFGVILYLCDPFQKSIWPANVSRYRWLLDHEVWLHQSLKAYQPK